MTKKTKMKVRIHIEDIDETTEARDAAALLSLFKREAARRAPFFARPIINGMSNLGFAAEAVKRDNARSGRNDAAPANAQQFLDWAIARGYATVLEA